MDIEMPQISGFGFLKIVKKPPKVILTSGFREYALEGFNFDVIDYLLKPITFERFLKSVEKFYQSGEEKDNNSICTDLNLSDDGFIYVNENKKMLKVLLSEILLIEGLREYVQVFTAEKRVITKTSLANLEKVLPVDGFLRIHKSFIVSLSKVEAFTSHTIEVPGKVLSIGRSYKNSVLNVLQTTGSIAQ